MSQMQYRVVSKDAGDSVVIDTIYAIDFNGKCFGMSDDDGDSIPDSCGVEKTNNCGENGTYRTIDCDYRRKNWFKIGGKMFAEYPAGNDLTKKWQLGLVTRNSGTTTVKYSCGDHCQIDLYDNDSDGLVDEAFLMINLFSVSFAGDMPYPVNEMLQRGILTAFDHFLPGTFTEALGEGAWEVGNIAFASGLDFVYNPYFISGSRITFDGRLLVFAADSTADAGVGEEDADVEKVSSSTPEAKAAGESHIMITESGGEMVDVTEEYSNH